MNTRETCLAAWRGAQQMAVATGAVVMTAPAFVGYALERLGGGDVDGARLLVPDEPADFSRRVRMALDAIEVEETPLRAAGGSGR